MIGLDISEQSLKLVRLANKADHELLNYCWQAVPSGVISRGVIVQPKVLTSVLKAALEQCKLSTGTGDPVVASIPETQSFLRVIDIPAMEEQEVTEAIQWEVAQHIPFGLDNVYLDWQAVQDGNVADKGRQEVLVGAAEKKVIDPLIRVLLDVGFDVAALELESQAIVRALISRDLRTRRGLLIVDLGGSATNVVIHDQGAIRFTASLQKGSGSLLNSLTPAGREVMTRPPQEAPPPDFEDTAKTLKPGAEELVMEVRGVVEFYNGLDTSHEVKEILLTGGGANLAGMDRAFIKYFDNVLVHRGNPWVNVLPAGQDTKPPLSLQESVHFSTALGLALRPVKV